ncbi:MAG: 30S ribosomal protein S5 [Planctomycetes bacterium]|nr:30S ribosomal protein S5 [Planctomycetota bacterium]
MKGGRVFSFGALTVVGDVNGLVGWGYGKAKEVPDSIAKGLHDARRNVVRVPLQGTTIPHEVRGHFGASSVILLPAAPGTGIIAGSVVRAVLESAGYRDVLTKSIGGNNNPRNLIRAVFDALAQLRSRDIQLKLRKES